MNKEEIEKAKEFMNNIKQTIQENNMLFGEENITIKAGKETAQNIEILLQYIDQLEQENKKLNKMIDEMTKVIIASSICDYFIKDNCKHYAGENKKLCDECIKQYFEKKVEEE